MSVHLHGCVTDGETEASYWACKEQPNQMPKNEGGARTTPKTLPGLPWEHGPLPAQVRGQLEICPALSIRSWGRTATQPGGGQGVQYPLLQVGEVCVPA